MHAHSLVCGNAVCCTDRQDWNDGQSCRMTTQVQTAVQLIMDTQPKGGAAVGSMSREEMVDHIAEDLLGKARVNCGFNNVKPFRGLKCITP